MGLLDDHGEGDFQQVSSSDEVARFRSSLVEILGVADMVESPARYRFVGSQSVVVPKAAPHFREWIHQNGQFEVLFCGSVLVLGHFGDYVENTPLLRVMGSWV